MRFLADLVCDRPPWHSVRHCHHGRRRAGHDATHQTAAAGLRQLRPRGSWRGGFLLGRHDRRGPQWDLSRGWEVLLGALHHRQGTAAHAA